jgi:hypothetical protein
MTDTQTTQNGVATAMQASSTEKSRAPRRRREPPTTYKADELKEPIASLGKVAQRGVSFERLGVGDLFALTSDGESVNIKINKSQARQRGVALPYSAVGLTIYEYVQ